MTPVYAPVPYNYVNVSQYCRPAFGAGSSGDQTANFNQGLVDTAATGKAFYLDIDVFVDGIVMPSNSVLLGPGDFSKKIYQKGSGTATQTIGLLSPNVVNVVIDGIYINGGGSAQASAIRGINLDNTGATSSGTLRNYRVSNCYVYASSGDAYRFVNCRSSFFYNLNSYKSYARGCAYSAGDSYISTCDFAQSIGDGFTWGGSAGKVVSVKSWGSGQYRGSYFVASTTNASNVLTVTAMNASPSPGATGIITVGDIIGGSNIPTGTTVVAQLTNTNAGSNPGMEGTYQLSANATGTASGLNMRSGLQSKGFNFVTGNGTFVCCESQENGGYGWDMFVSGGTMSLNVLGCWADADNVSAFSSTNVSVRADSVRNSFIQMLTGKFFSGLAGNPVNGFQMQTSGYKNTISINGAGLTGSTLGTFASNSLDNDITIDGTRLQKDSLSAHTAALTLTAGDTGRARTNTGASAIVNFTLPTISAADANSGNSTGWKQKFVVTNANGIRITAPASTTIQYGASVTAAAGNISSTTVGSVIEIEAIEGGKYFATFITGTWA